MTFSYLNRRTHLYLGLALLPWLFMYAASSIPFAHSGYFEQRDAAKHLPLWTLRLEEPVNADVPQDAAGLREFGRGLLARVGIRDTNFGVYRQSPTEIDVFSYTFWKSTQLKYFTDRQVLRVEDRRFRWDQFLTGMHGRAGYEQDGIVQNAWGVVVDLVQIAIVVWVASGLLMWWDVRGHRLWGALAIAAGALSFAIFVCRL